MKMKMKKFLVAALAVTMIMGSSSMAFAANEVTAQNAGSSGSGEGQGNAVAISDIFKVVVPTGNGTSFSYVLDPMGVISDTNAERYKGKTFEKGQKMYFYHDTTSAEVPYNYTSKSEAIKVINKSNVDVNLTVAATVTDVEQVSCVNATGNLNATDKAQVLFKTAVVSQLSATARTGSIPSATGVDMALNDGAATVTPIDVTMDQAKTGAYVTSWDATAKAYKLGLKSDVSPSDFSTVEFALMGSCNTAKKWGEVTKCPTPTLVWTVNGMAQTKEDGGSGSGTQTYKMTAGSPVEIPLGRSDVKTVEHQNGMTSAWNQMTQGSDYGVRDNTLRIYAANTVDKWLVSMAKNNLDKKLVRVTFSDNSQQTFTLVP